ncbi:MAG: DNA polymerase III subunit delta [Candidatus Azambacteria bacterium]|nr:DNA polymerase III subunit delta [Candidatus Azambacteria bacterium]
MIIFLYGKDSYRINQKIKEIIKGYEAKNPSGLNLINLDLTENRLEDFFESAKSSSLIPEKKLIILKNAFIADSEALLKFLKSQNLDKRDDVILLIITFSDFDKNELFKYLIKKPNQVQNFKPLKAYEVKSWAKQFSNSLGVDLTGEALDFLISNCGLDLWRLDREIIKLADFSAGGGSLEGGKIKRVISKSQVEELTVPNANYNIFRLTDALAKKDKKKALEALYVALDNGEKPTELLGLLAWQIRNLLRFKLNPDKSSDLKLHPFVLEKIKESARFFSVDELNAILSKIIDLDLAFKTGDLNEKTALSLLIAEL